MKSFAFCTGTDELFFYHCNPSLCHGEGVKELTSHMKNKRIPLTKYTFEFFMFDVHKYLGASESSIDSSPRQVKKNKKNCTRL
jgi:hypothetical protein